MENILVLTYPFEQTDDTIPYGIGLAGLLNTGLEFLYIIDTQQIGWNPPLNRNLFYPGQLTFSEYIAFETERMSDLILKKIDAYAPSASENYNLKVEQGTVNEVLKREGLRKNNLILLVCHSTDNSEYQSVNAISVIEETEYPVWIIYPGSVLKKDRILIVESGTDEYDRLIFSYVSALSEKLGSSVTRAVWKKDVQKSGLPVFTYDKTNELSAFIEKEKFDLIVTVKENKSFPEEIIGMDKTQKIIKKNNTPVLVFHENKMKRHLKNEK